MPEPKIFFEDCIEPRIGEKMLDGTVFSGASPETNKPMYAMPADAQRRMKFNEIAEYAEIANRQKAYGHDDWRPPTKSELNLLFNNRAAIGGFDLTEFKDSDPFEPGLTFGDTSAKSYYWSSTKAFCGEAWEQRFSDGFQLKVSRSDYGSVRLVR